ncbi:MAG: hypothetical protein JXB35_18040 [Anaerolineae bacterium]|nr:hypothetical protein [Anaerolineae bacterium]
MIRNGFGLVILVCVVMCAAQGCSSVPTNARAVPTESSAAPPAAAPPVINPAQVVTEFYDWYLGYEGNPMGEQAYVDHPALSPAWVDDVKEIIAGFDRGGYDPFLCAQMRPAAMTINALEISDYTASVEVTSDLHTQPFGITLQLTESGWKITQITCSAASEESTSVEEPPALRPDTDEAKPTLPEGDWLTFEEAGFGFTFRYPTDWVLEEVEIDSPDLPPAGNMDRWVYLLPTTWEGEFYPLQFEVYTLDAETLKMEVMPGDTIEQIEIGGQPVEKHYYQFGEFEALKWVFRHPTQANVAVIWSDYFRGWPDRLAGREDIAALIDPILSSFTFSN